MERIRAGSNARSRRQRRHHLFNRKLRPDGCAYGRFNHRGAGPDVDGPRVPADARYGDHHHSQSRRRDRRFEHSVRRQSHQWRDTRYRNESARFSVVRFGIKGDRLSHRENRRQARRRLQARRNSERHHEEDSGLVRTDDRLRGDENSEVEL